MTDEKGPTVGATGEKVVMVLAVLTETVDKAVEAEADDEGLTC